MSDVDIVRHKWLLIGWFLWLININRKFSWNNFIVILLNFYIESKYTTLALHHAVFVFPAVDSFHQTLPVDGARTGTV